MSRNKWISVLTSSCKGAILVDEGWIAERNFFEERCDSLEEAMALAKEKIAKDVCVIVRPSFNEEDEEGKFFQEWRSFDGEELKNIRWRYAPRFSC